MGHVYITVKLIVPNCLPAISLTVFIMAMVLNSPSAHKTKTVNSNVSSDTAGYTTDQSQQSTSSEQRQYADNFNEWSCSASTSRGSSNTVINQCQRDITSDRTDNSKHVESTGCLNQNANYSNVSANCRDLPPQGNG